MLTVFLCCTADGHPLTTSSLPEAQSRIRASRGGHAELDRLVQVRVAEVLAARDQFVFEPFFRSRQIAYELKRLQTVPEQRKWKVYFERYGCLICQTRKHIHVGNGMCNRCYSKTFQILKQIIDEGIAGEAAQPSRNALLQDTSAQGRNRLLPAGTGVHRRWNKRREKKAPKLLPSGDSSKKRF